MLTKKDQDEYDTWFKLPEVKIEDDGSKKEVAPVPAVVAEPKGDQKDNKDAGKDDKKDKADAKFNANEVDKLIKLIEDKQKGIEEAEEVGEWILIACSALTILFFFLMLYNYHKNKYLTKVEVEKPKVAVN